jgi:hypothetical protein
VVEIWSWSPKLWCTEPVGVYGGVKTTESSTDDAAEGVGKDLLPACEVAGVRLMGEVGALEYISVSLYGGGGRWSIVTYDYFGII